MQIITVGEFMEKITDVIYNDPATIVFWTDGSKTVVKCRGGDVYDPEKGLAMAISKKMLGNRCNYYSVFKKWLPKDTPTDCDNSLSAGVQNLCDFITKLARDWEKMEMEEANRVTECPE